MIKKRIPEVIIVSLIAVCIVCLVSISLAAAQTPPPIPDDPDATPHPTAVPSSGGGGSSYTPMPTPAPTPRPTPTPSPPYRLDAPLPSGTTVGTVSVGISGTQVSVPYGYLFTDVVKGGHLDVPVAVGDNASGRLAIDVDQSGSQTGTIRAMHLIANKTLLLGSQQIGVVIDLSLADLPAGSGVSFDLKPTDSVDMAAVNAQLATYGDKKFSPGPLLVFEATKNGLQNGKDITGAKLTFTVPRPSGFDPSAAYYVIRQSDGMMEVLNATLVGSPAADPLTFEVVSPHGLSTFSIVKAEAALATAAPTVAPTPSPAPAPESAGVTGYLAIFGTFVVGIVSGMIVMVVFLWFRSR